jgi:hypothetical protein
MDPTSRAPLQTIVASLFDPWPYSRVAAHLGEQDVLERVARLATEGCPGLSAFEEFHYRFPFRVDVVDPSEERVKEPVRELLEELDAAHGPACPKRRRARPPIKSPRGPLAAEALAGLLYERLRTSGELLRFVDHYLKQVRIEELEALSMFAHLKELREGLESAAMVLAGKPSTKMS